MVIYCIKKESVDSVAYISFVYIVNRKKIENKVKEIKKSESIT